MPGRRENFLAAVAAACVLGLAACAAPPLRASAGEPLHLVSADGHSLTAGRHLARDFAPLDSAGNINVVVEIPAGTNAKWEVDKKTGELRWEVENGRPRVVAYLPYPGNYGMIPRTLLPKALGGDGDPLDVLLLGPALPRASIVKARAIGVLKLLDRGEQDDKIVAVSPDSELGRVSSIKELERDFPGVLDIIEIWFSNYKGPGKMESRGFAGVGEAREVIRSAVEAYRRATEATE